MASWEEVEREGRRSSPRISGTEIRFEGGVLLMGSMWRSVKALDLLRDPRFALPSGSAEPPAWDGDAHSGRGVTRRKRR